MPAIQLPPPEPERPSVLLVDDEPIVLEVMAKLLKSAGFSLVAAESGEHALQHLDRREFACALVDKNLMGMDGLEVLRHVRKRQPRCACVLMTGYGSMGSAVEALRIGVVDYLEKPSPELDLIGARIQRAIRIQGAREQQDALAQRAREWELQRADFEKEREQLEDQNLQLRIELGAAERLLDRGAPDAVQTARRQFERREEALQRGAEQLVVALGNLQGEVKPGAQGALSRLRADAEAHLALLRRLP